ncbi:MAG: VWA domain-containing protein [Promethearchaeota archaeon]
MFKKRITLILSIMVFSLSILSVFNLRIGLSALDNDFINSKDVNISIAKNATGVSSHCVLEFTVELTNTLSESVHDITGYASQESAYIELFPSTEFNFQTIEPGASVEFSVFARVIEETTTTAVDVLLIIDASGSMGAEITSVQQKLTELTDTLSSEIPELRMGVIVYGWDKYSENPMSQTNNQLQFTNNFAAVRTFINSLYASGGWEPWGAALYLANTWEWRPTAQKLIIMVGDEDCDPSNVVGDSDGDGYYNGSELLDAVTDLREKGVVINTVVTDGPDANVENQFGWISAYSGGESVFLPELEQQGIDLPTLIQEWTIEMSREYRKELNITVTWRDGEGTYYRNTKTEGFWLDFAFPSIIISEKVTATGIASFSVEILAEVVDFSPISYVTLYHTAYGSWGVAYMTPIPDSSYYLTELLNVPGQHNLTYYIEASDILRNVGSTSEQWFIVEPTRVVVGEQNTIFVESGEQIFSSFTPEILENYYLILSGEEQIDSIEVSITYVGSAEPFYKDYSSTHFQNVSDTVFRKIFTFSLTTDPLSLNMTIPLDLDDFTFSYVWIKLIEVTGENYNGKMTEKIRVQGLEWLASNESYFIVDYNASSPLVVYGEVYSTDWLYIGHFSVIDEFFISENATYYVIIWAIIREGEYGISLTTEAPDVTDSYYAAEGAYLWDGSPIAAVMLTFLSLVGISIIVRRPYQK